ncbi:RNA polymerase subunit sigma-70 [Pseudalgibacter alginicilyticus]|uniref:RNA polymerase subunit sigma-70 n=1 Tax=Pseudalgibacter alginicilyticus TaxID=1736674 RepID=A0A0P0D758_9FLAO|nr:sigma-70 family RNA polymerase sigma factor [Pseudalgibacter alginicilyticus]ALJ04549.1 RNA polymerase subunit sigma-70 [Pseudalgibacter alginicilyticus]
MKTQDIWKLYGDDLKYFIISKVKDGVVADDLLQEVFIKIHTKITSLRDNSKLKPWVFSIARYTVMDYFRKQPSFQDVSDEYFIDEDEHHEHSEQDCLRSIISNLPKKYRIPLFLADIKGLKQTEVAQQLNLSLPTAKSQIQRARKLIAKGFMDCCGFKLNEEGYLVGELKERADCKVCH